MTAILARLATVLADRYRVERELGAGGMATVYLAHDLKHDREVALKVLHPDLGAALGADRFLSEIKTTARLQHPHILPLLDSGEAGGGDSTGLLYYVMPFVRGETLRARLERERQLPVDDALRIARECADALHHAHSHGIIHRDIKPENILLQDGHAVVADFGIALAVQSAGGARMTQTGLSLGTPQYMSPEQAMGEKTIDARSDIYSLGAVTYEMLTGEPPFTGASVQAIVAKVLTERPVPVSTTRDTVPPGLERAVLRSLAKLPADRFATAKAFADALDDRGESEGHSADADGMGRRSANVETRVWKGATVLLAVAALVATAYAWRLRPESRTVAGEAHVIRARFDLPRDVTVADAMSGNTIAISPDGSMTAFTALTATGYRLYVRHVNELDGRELTDANVAGRNLTFSPDGKWIAYTDGNAVRKVSVDGGASVLVGSTGGFVAYGMAWGHDDTLYIGSFSSLRKIAASGGQAAVVIRADSSSANFGQRWPVFSPDEKRIVYASGNGSGVTGRMAVMEIATGKVTNFETQLSVPVGFDGDQLVFVDASGQLVSMRIEPGTHRPLAAPKVLESGLFMDPTSGAKVALSASGTLVYIRGKSQRQPVLLTPGSGVSTPLIDEPRLYTTPRFSPDGRRVAVTVSSPTASDVWSYDIRRRTMARITTTGASLRPEWTPDGKSVVFLSRRDGRTGIWRQAADGSGSAELLFVPKQEPFEALLSMDQQWIVYRTAPGLENSRDILAVPFAGPASGERVVKELATGPGTESLPRFSPDGKWLAYQTNESGRFEIVVRPFPDDAARIPVTANGGTEPVWGHDGKSLYFRGPVDEIMKVDVTTGASFSIGATTMVGKGEYLLDTSHQSWDVAPDGRLLLLKRAGEPSELIVVHNWVQELRARTRVP